MQLHICNINININIITYYDYNSTLCIIWAVYFESGASPVL